MRLGEAWDAELRQVGGAVRKPGGRKLRTGRTGRCRPGAQVGGETVTSDRLDRLGV